MSRWCRLGYQTWRSCLQFNTCAICQDWPLRCHLMTATCVRMSLQREGHAGAPVLDLITTGIPPTPRRMPPPAVGRQSASRKICCVPGCRGPMGFPAAERPQDSSMYSWLTASGCAYLQRSIYRWRDMQDSFTTTTKSPASVSDPYGGLANK